jgi:hypothetical protein
MCRVMLVSSGEERVCASGGRVCPEVMKLFQYSVERQESGERETAKERAVE